MIKNEEKAKVHVYARYAQLTRAEYVAILRAATGKDSCTDPQFKHSDVDRALAHLEAVLWQRIDEGIVSQPEGITRYYYRSKLPKVGMINSRLRFKLELYWRMLKDYLPEEERCEKYLAGIIANAAGIAPCRILDSADGLAWERVPAEAARLAIEAVKDRLNYTVSAGPK